MTRSTLFGDDRPLPTGDPLMACEQPRFDGSTYDHHRDGKRLSSQLDAVRHCLSDGSKWTTHRLMDRVKQLRGGRNASESSITARIRDLRKPAFGGYTINQEHTGNGVHVYWMPNPPRRNK